MHGHSLGNRVGIWSIILRIDVPRPPFEMFLFRIPISELEAASIVSDGILAANLQYSSFLLLKIYSQLFVFTDHFLK